MKKCLLVAVGLAVRIGLGAVEVGGLPAWELADTEASTNVPFAFPPVAVRHFLVSLELAGTPSNNVQVAFGRDANTNGVLEIEETGISLGWDCGRWRVREGMRDQGSGIREWTAEAVTTNEVKVLDLDVTISREQGRRIASAENGVEIDWDDAAELTRALYDNSWDTLRLTVRGVDRADETLRAAVRIEGTKIIVK